MLRKRGIQTQIVFIIVVALAVLTVALQVVNTRRQRATLVDGTRKESLVAASAFEQAAAAIQSILASAQQSEGVETDILGQQMLWTMTLSGEGVGRLMTNNPNLDFAVLTASNGVVLLHTDNRYMGRSMPQLGLADVPLDRTVRRDVPGFGEVYLTRVEINVQTPFPSRGLTLIMGVPAGPIDDELRQSMISSVLVTGGVLLGVSLLAALFVRLSITGPLVRLREGAQRFGAGELDYRLETQGSRELRDLSRLLNEMATNVQESRDEVTTLYREMEASAQEHARDIEISAEIGRFATSQRDLDRLLAETVEQIHRRFDDVYHAQVFLLDDMQRFAVLVASTGEAGQKLLEQEHKLGVGSNSIIGRVTARGEVVIASDTLAGEVPWRPNPLLPDTRAEMALPLIIEDRVIGALDVQSKAPEVFTEQMVQVVRVVADQLAIAIQNARLLRETERRMREIDVLNRQLTGAVWQDYIDEERTHAPQGYMYDQQTVQPLADTTSLLPHRAETPIQVRGETIGTLLTALPENRALSDEDQALVTAVADRVALAIENARLFHQTQRALAETERLYDTARAVSSSSELTTIYQLVIDQLSAASYVDDVEILLTGPDPVLVQYLERVYSWHRAPTASADTRERLRITSVSQDDGGLLPSEAPVGVANIAQDLPPDHPLAAKFESLGTHSAVLAPLNAGGRWFGLLLCSSQRPDMFRSAYVTFASALADQLAVAIENRRLFEEAQTEARRARALAEAGQLASQIGGDYEAGLDSLFRAVAGPGQYDRWWFGLLHEDGASLARVTASEGDWPEVVAVADDANALAEAARIGELVLVNDPADHPVVTPPPDAAVATAWGKHVAVPVMIGAEAVGVLLVGRALDEPNLDERDIQLAATLASQIGVATQNARLFDEAESQRQNLQTIVDTMPVGILVMDRRGGVILSNDRLQELMGPQMRPGTAERPTPYPMVHGDTRTDYSRQDWPLSRVFATGEAALVDDMCVLHPDGHEINLLAQAAPIRDADGSITAVVGAFQDITELQELERALQDSLHETTMLYEASRSISRTTTMDELLRVMLFQVRALSPDRAFIVLREDDPTAPVELVIASYYPADESPACEPEQFEPLLGDQPMNFSLATASDEQQACLHAAGMATLGSFPLNVRGTITGWVIVGFDEPYEFPTEQRRLMTTLADQAAVTIENQRLLARTEAALQDTAVLYHASRAIAESDTPADVLDAMLTYARPPGVNQASLYMMIGEPQPTAAEIAAQWRSDGGELLTGTRYLADDIPFWNKLVGSQIVSLDVAQSGDLDTRGRVALANMGMKGAVIVPVGVAGRPVGAILMGMDRPWTPEDNNIRIYRALSDQAGVSLENTRLYQQTQRRARQLAASADISRAVTSILSLDELLPQVVRQIMDSFEYDHAQIFLVSDDGLRANLVASTGDAGRQLLALKHNLPVGSQSVIGQVTLHGEPVIALDTADAEVVHYPNPLLPDTRSEMALPLIARGQILGALDVQSNEAGAFTEEDTRVLAALADVVATAIDNARLFEVAQERAEEMAFLFNVTTAATMSPDLDEALKQAVDTLRETMDVTSASIYLPDETGEYLHKGAGTGMTDANGHSSAISIDRGLIGWVARHNEAVVIGDLTSDPRRLPDSESARSAIAVPLRAAGALVGVLVAESERLNAFRQHDLQLLQTLSGSLAAIIQNSRLLREMQEANIRLQEVDRLKTNFLAAMSHELRTPLNSIIGFSRVILKGIDGPLTETQEQDLNTIYESGKHLLGLVNDILDQAKIEAGKMELSLGYFQLDEVVKGVMSTAVGLTRDKPIQLVTNIADNLPQAYGDEFRTRQVLLNLVSNASKFTHEGAVTVSVFPVREGKRRFLQVSVADTGIGIAEKDMPLLFEAFQQVDNSTTRSAEGTGMGLPLAKSFTELQGGRIWVQSEPGVGSTFSITIPATPPPEEGAEDDLDEDDDQLELEAFDVEALVSAAPPVNNPVVLVVEDDSEVINLYRRYLSRNGYDVLGTTHPEDVVELMTAYGPFVVLLDVNMPDRDGWAVLETIKQNEETAAVPVVVCSLNDDTERGYALGAADYLVKPFTEEQLLDAIHRLEADVNRQRILFVDDHPESIRAFREALAASERYEVMEATTGQEALALLQQSAPVDLVILDLRMPGIDGFEVLQSLRSDERTAHIPVLVLTAEDINADERASLDTLDVFRKDALDEQHLVDHVATQLRMVQEN